MFKIIPKKNNAAAEINCDLNKINLKQLSQIKLTLNNYGMIYLESKIYHQQII